MLLTLDLIEKLRTEFKSRKNPMGEQPTIALKLIEYLFEETYLEESDNRRSDINELLGDIERDPLNLKFLIECAGLRNFYTENFQAIDQLIFDFMENTGSFITINETPYYQYLTIWAIRQSVYHIQLFLEDLESEDQ